MPFAIEAYYARLVVDDHRRERSATAVVAGDQMQDQVPIGGGRQELGSAFCQAHGEQLVAAPARISRSAASPLSLAPVLGESIRLGQEYRSELSGEGVACVQPSLEPRIGLAQIVKTPSERKVFDQGARQAAFLGEATCCLRNTEAMIGECDIRRRRRAFVIGGVGVSNLDQGGGSYAVLGMTPAPTPQEPPMTGWMWPEVEAPFDKLTENDGEVPRNVPSFRKFSQRLLDLAFDTLSFGVGLGFSGDLDQPLAFRAPWPLLQQLGMEPKNRTTAAYEIRPLRDVDDGTAIDVRGNMSKDLPAFQLRRNHQRVSRTGQMVAFGEPALLGTPPAKYGG